MVIYLCFENSCSLLALYNSTGGATPNTRSRAALRGYRTDHPLLPIELRTAERVETARGRYDKDAQISPHPVEREEQQEL